MAIIAQLAIPKFKDEILKLLLERIRMNRYDINISNSLAKISKELTQKQRDLVEKFIYKYRKQLSEQSLDYKNVLKLCWENPARILVPITKDPYLKIENDVLKIFFPYNEELVKELRTIRFDDDGIFLNKDTGFRTMSNIKYDFQWDEDALEFAGPVNIHLLQGLIKFANKHNITIDSNINNIINDNDSDPKHWTPHLHISKHKQLYISCIVESMVEPLESFNMFDLSLLNIEEIATTLGIRAPYSYDSNTAELIQSNGNLNTAYNTQRKGAKDALYTYLKDTNSKVLVFLLDSENTAGTFVDPANFVKWIKDLPTVIPHINIKVKDRDFDTIITNYTSIDMLFGYSYNRNLTKRAIDNIASKKIIRIY